MGQQQVVVGGGVGLEHLGDALCLDGLAQHPVPAKREPVALGQFVMEPVVRVGAQHAGPSAR